MYIRILASIEDDILIIRWLSMSMQIVETTTTLFTSMFNYKEKNVFFVIFYHFIIIFFYF